MRLGRKWALASGRLITLEFWRTNAAEREKQGLALTYVGGSIHAQGPRGKFGWSASLHLTVLSRGVVIATHRHPV